MTRSSRLRGSLTSAVAITAAVSISVLAVTTDAATAKPASKPGSVKGLVLTPSLHDTQYTVDATWNPAPKATSYQVRLTNAANRHVLEFKKVTTNAFDGTATVSAGVRVQLQVTPYNGNRKGKGATAQLTVPAVPQPDKTAPTASYTVSQGGPNDSHATITLDPGSLKDNVSSSVDITQDVDWGDGAHASGNGKTTTSFSHDYLQTKQIYHPVVTLTDKAGNSRPYTFTVVVADTTHPTGTFSVSPSAAWAKWTSVSVKPVSLGDDLSQPGNIGWSVNWGDGTSQSSTTGSASSLSHRYATAGSFTPAVTITDEAGNTWNPAPASTVAVKVDSKAPRVRVIAPKVHKQFVRSWRTLNGRATDAGTGVRKVRVAAIEKRGKVWYGYRPATKTWVRGGKTRAAAWRASRVAPVTATVAHTWSLPLRHLTKGVLVAKVSGVDNVGNKGAWKVYQRSLTRR
jgi:hypothetical protein